jgi:lipoprotein-releasing system permease protein
MAYELPYEWTIGTRYLRSRHRSGFVSFVASMSVLGLALGVAVLIVVLSVLNGYEHELRSRMLSVTSHATITGMEGEIPDWRARRAVAEREPGVKAAIPFIDPAACWRTVSGWRAPWCEASCRRKSARQWDWERLKSGSLADLEAGKFRVILGSALATELNVKLGQSVILMTPEGSATPAGFVPRQRRFTVAGIFESGMYEYDRGLALTHMSDAAKMYRLGDRVTGIRLALDDPFTAPRWCAASRRPST